MAKPTGQEEADLLKEVRDRMQLCVSAQSEQRRESLDDFAFVAGVQWPDNIYRIRQVEQRPVLTINKLPAFVHQVVNDFRQNRPAIKVHPVDNGADVEKAEIIQGLMRHIEYDSNAGAATDTAVQHSAIGGFGFFRIATEYESPDSFDQKLKFVRVQNPFTVYIDPFSVEPDGSDMRYAFVTDLMDREEFEAEYPNAKTSTAEQLTTGTGDAVVQWIGDKSIRIAEYYKIKTKQVKLLRLADGSNVYQDDLEGVELPEGAIVKERMTERRTVCWYKVTAAEVLEYTEIPGEFIPVFPVYGDEMLINGRVIRAGMVRFAKDPQRMYNFWMTSATEEVALRPKTPFIGAVGQFETAKKAWASANVKSHAFLEYDPVEVNGSMAPPPQRSQMADIPSGALQMAMHASDNIQATTGIFDASLGAKGNETSGRAIVARQREGDTANYHFADNLARSIRHAGRVMLGMIPAIYDAPRVLRMLGEDGESQQVQVNQQTATGEVLNDLKVGKYDVTINTGPSYQTKRVEAVDAMLEAGRAYPPLWQIAGDKIVRAMDWPMAQDIADRLEKAIPPNLKGDEQQQLPPEVQQVLEQAQQEIQALQAALQEAQSGMDKARLDADVKMALGQLSEETKRYVADVGAESRRDVEELKGMVALIVQKLQPPPMLASEVAGDMGKDGSQPTGEVVA